MAWRRGSDTVVAVNLSGRTAQVEAFGGVVVLGTRREREGERVTGSLPLGPAEGVVISAD